LGIGEKERRAVKKSPASQRGSPAAGLRIGTGGAPRPYERSSLLVRSKAGGAPAAQTFRRVSAKGV